MWRPPGRQAHTLRPIRRIAKIAPAMNLRRLFALENLLNWLLVFVPVAWWLEHSHADPLYVFIAACLAIIPLAGLMGHSTEALSHSTGPGVGGLLNASFGNAAELIIAFMALRAGKIDIVQASITGSII